ncbi:hypothetical protein EGK14_14390 [Erwinia sp. 198]|nr:hypothetical protein EGK14_14390 [Erwinia sp. 198]
MIGRATIGLEDTIPDDMLNRGVVALQVMKFRMTDCRSNCSILIRETSDHGTKRRFISSIQENNNIKSCTYRGMKADRL